MLNMMRVLAVACILLLAAGPAASERFPNPRLVFQGGVAVPITPETFSKGSEIGFGGGVGVSLQPTGLLVLYGSFDLWNFGLDNDAYRELNDVPTNEDVSGGEVATIYISGNVRLNVPGFSDRWIQPYVIGGAGLFRWAPDDVRINSSIVDQNAESALGVHGGGGLDVSFVKSIGFFFETIYVYGFTSQEGTGYLPFRMGMTVELGPRSS